MGERVKKERRKSEEVRGLCLSLLPPAEAAETKARENKK
jgi:hypothetical protein